MKIGNKIYFITILVFLISIACSNKESGNETQKLIKAQNEVLERYEKTDESLLEIKSKSDSLISRMRLLKEKKEKAEKDLQQLIQEKGVTSDGLNKKKQEDLEEKISVMENQLDVIENQLDQLESEDSSIEERKDTIYVNQKSSSETKFSEKERIENLKAKLDSTEKVLIIKRNLLEINQQKIALAQKKINLQEEEKEIYLQEKSTLIQNKGNRNTISRYDDKIRRVNESLSNEHQEITEYEENLSSLNDAIGYLEQKKIKLKTVLGEVYTDNELVDSGALGKTAYKSEKLNDELYELEEPGQALKDQESETEAKHKILDIVKSGEEEKNEITKEKDSLNRIKSPKLKSSDVETLRNVENTINQKKDQIDNLRQEVKTEAKKLEEKQKEPIVDKKKSVSRLTKIITVVIAVALVLFIILYLVGKKRNTTK